MHEATARATVTFAVIGRNEARTLRTSLAQALEAAGPQDRVVFVDGGSSDDSVEIARSMGVDAIAAGAGKGRAVATAARAAGTTALCTVDADIDWSEVNIPAALRDAYSRTGAHMVVGHFVQPERLRSITPGLYQPLVAALFPAALKPVGPTPITGFRLLAPGRVPAELPSGYGVETYLNLRLALDGLSLEWIDLGRYEGPLKEYGNIDTMARDIVTAILDLAVAEGRLATARRSAFEAWAQPVIEHLRALPVAPGRRAAYIDHLMELAARRLPEAAPAVAGP